MDWKTTTERDNCCPVVAAVPTTSLSLTQGTRLPLHRRGAAGFTLAELLVTLGVLVVLVLLFAQLLKSAATVTTLGHKQMDADSQARELLDRMAIDVMQMVKRSDVNYHLKIDPAPATNTTDCQQSPVLECGTQRPGNDEIAFYSNVPGYYASDSTGSQQSQVSLVGYRVNSSATTLGRRMERLGAGLVWNGVSASNLPNNAVLFWTALDPWSTAKYNTTSTFDIVGPNVFRFEYYYLLKGQTVNGTTYTSIPSSVPWDTRISSVVNPSDPHVAVSGMRDVAAVIVDIAVIDPRSRALLTDAQLTTLAGNTVLADYNGQAPGILLSNWRNAMDTNTTLPRAALSSIRLYERFLYISPPTLGTL